ncbi:MAG: enoyl-CoA hydratase-related protein [Actinomycetota bacterium]|nr:enoyl-CoA hydratase-related protein [Actinomycetota bacterium]
MPQLDRNDDVFVLDLGATENRITPSWSAEILSLLDKVDEATGPKALVTAARGKFWSNGLDLAWVGDDVDRLGQLVQAAESVLSRILTLAFPTVAAIGGHAYAAGGLLALAHDYRVMRADRGFFCLPEVDLHMAFRAGMSALVQAKVTPAAARDLMIIGRRYGGVDAEAAAIVDAAVPSDEVIPRALAMAGALAPKADPVIGTIKVGMYGHVYRALSHEG